MEELDLYDLLKSISSFSIFYRKLKQNKERLKSDRDDCRIAYTNYVYIRETLFNLLRSAPSVHSKFEEITIPNTSSEPYYVCYVVTLTM